MNLNPITTVLDGVIVGDDGSVPELLVVNRGPDSVLVIDEEELHGAKQNRVVNLTILVAAKLTITVPCVEAQPNPGPTLSVVCRIVVS